MVQFCGWISCAFIYKYCIYIHISFGVHRILSPELLSTIYLHTSLFTYDYID